LPVAVDVVRYQVRGLDKEGSTANWFASRAGFWKTRQDLLQLGADPQVATVILDLGNQRVAPAMAGILARQVTDLRQKGKRVLAWAQDLDMGTLQVLAAANKAAISPLGMVRSRGYSVQSLYFGQTLQKWGVNVQVVRTGPWKSAMEPFMQGHMSASARENLTRFLTDLDSNWLTSVSQGRKLPRSLLQSFVDSGSSLPREAVRLGIVDTLLEPAELNKWGGLRAKSANLLGLESQAWAGGKRVAVLVLEGQIVDGESNGLIPTQSNLSAPRVVAAIEKLQADPLVKAVVLRVQSPGGSVVGSERIRLALKKLAARKPVVASFGSLAASGAYLFSLPSERIWAEPEGVVGSIGVFAAKVTFQKLLDTLGVHVETVSTHKHAGDNSPYIAWDSVQSGRMQELVGDAWKQFAGLVREARDLDSAQLARVDGGRVFSGARAQSLGLVDTLGGLEQAVAWTAQRVGLDPRAQPLLVDPQANVWDDQVGRWAMAQASPKEMQDIFRIWQHAVAQSQTVLWAQSMEWIWP
jgi:protease-4